MEIDFISFEIRRLAVEGDRAFGIATANLLSDVHDETEIIRFKDIYENLVRAIDCCSDIANLLEKIVIENT
jgi:uncharacterized protein Yka (UPF0111/DUF47 family)